MQSVADIAAEMDQGLSALFHAGLELAMQVQSDAVAAETPEDRTRLTLTFHRISRSIRQTAALRMKIAREAEHSGRETSAEAAKLEAQRAARRKGQVRADVQRLIWREAEAAEDPDLREDLAEDLDALLEIEVQDAAFLETAPQILVARIAANLKLTPGDDDLPAAQGPLGGVDAGLDGGEARRSSA